jgi:hypothetical protein
MKDKALIGALATMIIVYLLVSFAVWDLNAGRWDMGARVMYVIFSPMFAAIVYSGIRLDER